LFVFQKTNGDIDASYLILIPGDHPGDDDGDDEGDDEMSPHYVTFRHFYKGSKHFGLLASVFPLHAVYLVNKVFSKSLLFFNLYMCIKDYIFVHIPKDKW